MHVSAEEQDCLDKKAEAELRSRGLESWAPDTEETRKEEEDIVSSHVIKARERAPPNPSLLSRQPSPMVLGTALTSPLPHLPSGPASSAGSRPASVASGPLHPAEAAHTARHASSDSDDTCSPHASPLGSPTHSPARTRRAVACSNPFSNSAFFPLSGVVAPPAPSSHTSDGDVSAELHASARLSPRASHDHSHHRGVSFDAETHRDHSHHRGVSFETETHRGIRSDGAAAPASAPGAPPPGTCSSQADTGKPPWLPRSAMVKLAFLSAISQNSPTPAASRSSPAAPADAKPITYEHVQLETAKSRSVAVAQHRLSFFDRLERIRRGQSTAHRTSPARSSSSSAAEKSLRRQRRSARSQPEEETLPVAEESGKHKKNLKFAPPESEEKLPASRPASLPDRGQPLLRSGTMRAKVQQAQEESQMGDFERESSRYESFQFEDEESTLHLEFRASATESDRFILLVVSVLLIVAIGVLLGCISAAITLTEARIWAFKTRLVDAVMWPCEKADRQCEPNEEPHALAAFLAYLGLNLFLILGAAVLTHFAPRAALSGLPPLKAYLNGTRVPGLLHPRTMVAKVVGITLVVATGLPMGREGPMVHTGACVAALLSRIRLGPMPRLLLGIPSRQRVWVGMGAAAGVAAAFNAPLGGILYSFEEVCSHWSAKLTWRSFFCVTIAAYIFNLLIRLYIDSTDGIGQGDEGDIALVTDTLLTDSFVIGLNFEESHTYGSADFGWLAIVGILGGLLGAAYSTIVVHAVRLRRRFLGSRPRGRVMDALWWSTLAFSIYYWSPFLFPCKPCPDGTDCGHAYTTAYTSPNATGGVSRRLGEAIVRPLWVFGGPAVPSRRRLAGGGGGLVFVQHACPAHEYNEMATLLLSPQEGLIKHLLQRESYEEYLSDGTMAAMLGLYFLVAVLVFGISVPAGNFIPALTLGAALGRFLGDVLPGTSEGDAGRLALMGAAAVLCGVTRMTITLAAILVEVTHDVGALLPLMYTLAIAKVSADLLAPSFDDGMMRAMRLPYLEEEPPHEFELLTARDVMPDKVVVLREVERVGDVFAVLKRTRHSGFPVVDVGQCNDCTFFSGIIVRRHLLVLLKKRVWEYHAAGLPEPADVRLAFVSSSRSDVVDDREDLASLSFTDEEKQAVLDLRPYMDPSPYLANELMPLRRVYRLFGEIGVRHLPVVDCREQVVGIITRRDVQPEIIEERVIAKERERVKAARRALYAADQAAFDMYGGPSPHPPRGGGGGSAMAAAGMRTSKAARGLLTKAGVLKPVLETNDDDTPSPLGSPLHQPLECRLSEGKSAAGLIQLMAAESLESRGIETVPLKAIKARKALSSSLDRLPQIAPPTGMSASYDSLPQARPPSPDGTHGPPSLRQSVSGLGPVRRRNVGDVVTTSKADEDQYSVLHVTRRPAGPQHFIPVVSPPVARRAGLSRHPHPHGETVHRAHGHDGGDCAAHSHEDLETTDEHIRGGAQGD